MAYNTQNILTDLGTKPIAQYYNPTTDVYEALEGAGGASRVLLWDATGSTPLLTQTNAGYIQANDGAIATLGSTADTAVVDPTLSASEVALLKGLMKQLQGTGTGATPVSLTGSNPAFENPYNTSLGQVVTSSADSFWSRVARYGRLKSAQISKMALSTTGSFAPFSSLGISPGYLFYPKMFIATADIDCELGMYLQTGYTINGTAQTINYDTGSQTLVTVYSSFVKGGTPLQVNFDGEIWADGDLAYGVGLQAATTTAGNGYGVIVGYEVSKQYA